MGGLDAAAVAGMATTAVNLMNSANKNNKAVDRLSVSRQENIRKRKNLLDQQLANRRASVGAMGIGGSASSAAVQKRLAKEAYDEIEQQNQEYSYQYQKLKDENKRSLNGALLNSFVSNAGKLIK